jgi:hypothetical protein
VHRGEGPAEKDARGCGSKEHLSHAEKILLFETGKERHDGHERAPQEEAVSP